MPHALKLEDFGRPSAARPVMAGLPPAEDLEAIKLDAFETGYRNGWDDCAAADTDAKQRIGADLARSIKDASFTYYEARSDVMGALKPLLTGIADQLLPELAAAALGPVVESELAAMLDQVSEATCELVAAPSVCPALRKLAEAHVESDLRVVPEPAYSEGHVTLRFGTERREIDMTSAVKNITAAIRDFVAESQASPSQSAQNGAVA